MDSELVTKKFKTTQCHDAEPAQHQCVDTRSALTKKLDDTSDLFEQQISFVVRSCRLGSAQLDGKQSRVASAHHACKSLVRVRCSLKHLNSR